MSQGERTSQQSEPSRANQLSRASRAERTSQQSEPARTKQAEPSRANEAGRTSEESEPSRASSITHCGPVHKQVGLTVNTALDPSIARSSTCNHQSVPCAREPVTSIDAARSARATRFRSARTRWSDRISTRRARACRSPGARSAREDQPEKPGTPWEAPQCRTA